MTTNDSVGLQRCNPWDYLIQFFSKEYPVKHDPLLIDSQMDLFKKLFKNNETGKDEYSKVFESFMTWWTSPMGSFAIEQLPNAAVHDMYKALSDQVHAGNLTAKRIVIELIYDQCLLGTSRLHPYFITYS
jgi:hypothetical protein